MKIMIIGSGGREHAIAWKIAQSPRVTSVICVPGNPGMATLGKCIPIKVDDLPALLACAKEEKVDLVVVGPELPLTLGIVDLFEKEGIRIFGPNKAAAQLEESKAFTKDLARDENIPSAYYEVFTDYDKAVDFLSSQAYPIVIKADGLAAGKGVVIAMDRAEAVHALDQMFRQKIFGAAGETVVIEEFLRGEETSFHAFVDGSSILPLDTARDHKRVGEADTGPNTGGMGTYSPSPLIDEALRDHVIETILKPTLRGLKKKGIQYKGILYAGLMLTAKGPKLLEYNVRLGDPETQSLMMRLDTDLLDVIEATIDGKLSGMSLLWKPEIAVCVVMAAHGYPADVRSGDIIKGLENASSVPQVQVFHAGTKSVGEHVVTSGGRVLGVTALGKDRRQARERAYDACEKIHWAGVHYRRDIGLK